MKYKQFLTVFSLLIIVSLSGCSSIEKEKSPNSSKNEKYVKSLEARYLGQSVLNFNSENLKNVHFEGDLSVGNTSIKYPEGLEEQARYIAARMDDVFSHVESETGIDFAINPQVYMLWTQEYPQNINVHFTSDDPNIFPIPIFVKIGQEDPNLILENNNYFPYMLTHEITEVTPVYPDNKGVVKNDSRARVLIFTFDYSNHTRWFREGFANYAGYIAMDYLRTNRDKNISEISETAHIHQTPFSSLRDIGKGLFKWEQYSSPKIKGDYYSAALGLFLVLEDQFGRDAIRDVIIDLDNHKNLRGSDLIKLINRKFNTDIEKLVDDFKFIKIGVRIVPLNPVFALNRGLELDKGLYVQTVEPNTIASEAGMDANDVIVAINDMPIASRFDFEMELFKAMKQPKAKFKIWRKDEGYKELELNLDKAREIPDKKHVVKNKEAQSVKSFGIVFSLKMAKGPKDEK